MKWTKPLLTAISIMMVFSLVLAAQPFMGEQMGHRPMMQPSLTRVYMMLKAKQKDFNISDKQLDQIKTKAFAFEEKIIPIESKNKLHRLELKKLMTAEKKDYEKISTVLAKISENRRTIMIEGMKAKDAIDGILTPGQRDAIKEAMQKRFKDRGFSPKGKRRGMGMMQRDFFPHRGIGDMNINDNQE